MPRMRSFARQTKRNTLAINRITVKKLLQQHIWLIFTFYIY